MIPQKIHYCWFGKGEKSELIKKCINSWKTLMPNYEIIEWNEENFPLDNIYAQEAYEQKQYAFVSDYVRLKIIYEQGGIYLDTDVEIIKDLSPLLQYGKGYIGFERTGTISTGLGFAAPAKSKPIATMLEEYNNLHFISDNICDKTPCPIRNTKALEKLGLIRNNTKQVVGDIIVYPKEYFCPLDYDSGQLNISNNTYTIHHYGYSWADENSIRTLKLKRKIFKIFPQFCAQFVFNIIYHTWLFFNKEEK